MILAFDTTTSACAAAVCDGDLVIAERSVALERGHAEILLPMIEEVLAEAGAGYDALAGIAVTRGPGAFTGIRIGLAAARGLALATGLPVTGVTTLEAMAATAAAHSGRRQIAIVMDTKRRDFFVQVFESGGAARSEPAVVAPDRLAAHLADTCGRDGNTLTLAGDGLDKMPDGAVPPGAEWLVGVTSPAPLAIAQVARRTPAATPVPLYLRAPEARLPGARR
jgi:tRNA threonylcarbamoyladenosine biosynthesis protein TsaB